MQYNTPQPETQKQQGSSNAKKTEQKQNWEQEEKTKGATAQPYSDQQGEQREFTRPTTANDAQMDAQQPISRRPNEVPPQIYATEQGQSQRQAGQQSQDVNKAKGSFAKEEGQIEGSVKKPSGAF